MTIQEIVVFTDDPQLQGELQTAAEGLGERQPRLRFVADRHDLFEAVRSKPPGLVLAPFGETPGDVARLAKELSGGAPPIPLAALAAAARVDAGPPAEESELGHDPYSPWARLDGFRMGGG